MPGLYTHGAAKVAAEVAKGKGKTVLLMGWPGPNSESTVRHYREVVYRTGRTGGMMVAPAALAWEAAGKPAGEAHPSDDGAYIAAASIYSRIWNKSPKASSYTYKDTLADAVHKTVTASVGAKHYTGRLDVDGPFRFFDNRARGARPGKSPGGSSTEQGLTSATNKAIKRAGAQPATGTGYRIGRDSGRRAKDYRIGDKEHKGKTFAYRYQTNTGNPDIHLAQIFSQDINLADQVMHESKTYRAIPRRLMWASLHQLDPTIKPMSSHGHLSHEATTACGSFVYTIISGRCPVEPKPNPVTKDWLSQKVGYEVAWQLATGQSRAPGFQVLPGDVAVDAKAGDTMTVRFVLPPQHPVTIHITCTDGAAVATPATLTFTPANYNTPQKVVVKAAAGAARGTTFKVQYRTTSKDEVYDGLSDAWDYKVNSLPVATKQSLSVYAGVPQATLLAGTDADGQALAYSIVKQPALGTLKVDGAKVLFTAKAGAEGRDRFVFKANDGLEDSAPTTVAIEVKPKSRYDFNLLVNATADLGTQGWTTAEKADGMSAREGGTNGVAYFLAEGQGTAEVYQDIDVRAYTKDIDSGKQAFLFVGHRGKAQETRFVIEFRDKNQQVLSSYDSGDTQKPKRGPAWFKTEKSLSAPAGTTSIRVRMQSRRVSGRHNTGAFDDLSLTALKPD